MAMPTMNPNPNPNQGETAGKWTAPPGFYLVSEPTFVPRIGSVAGDGDEGYLLAFVCAAAGSEGLHAEVSTTLTANPNLR